MTERTPPPGPPHGCSSAARGRSRVLQLPPVSTNRLALATACAVLVSAAFAGCTAPAPAPAAAAPAASAAPPRPAATAPANGFGDKIAWRGLAEGFAEAAAQGKPIMLVVHASWCPRCKALQPTFFDSALVEVSDRFVMINVDQDREPEVLRHGPDGQYIPRVLFFEPGGAIDPSILNPTRTRFRYFYNPPDDLVGAMRRALDRHAKT